MRILLVTDAWFPQINGVVRTLSTVVDVLRQQGHEVATISPDQFRSIPCPSYAEIRLALFPGQQVRETFDTFAPNAIHIATEGPLGMTARRLCVKRNLPFTTSFHTKFPEYIHARFRVPVSWTYAWLRRFHGKAERMMVTTPTIEKELGDRGFTNTALWTRGVDTELFRPRSAADIPAHLRGLPRPLYLYIGRVSIEKNISAFLDCNLSGSKIVVGDGPQLNELKSRYPDVVFTGAKFDDELACHYASADVFVFPSRTDTFGLVLLEALASGVPVAAYPVPGPIDVITDPTVGCLDNSLETAINTAVMRDRARCRDFALNFSWERCAELFQSYLAPLTEASQPSRTSSA
ncbi:MAG: glycosyltransferase [Alphaproteobacteria bacterium]|nr:glycosyltransferase [Alphaproteobacteria bacterium]